jgi:hypothetical protein
MDLRETYPIEEETHRYQIKAVGLIPGTQFTTDIYGDVKFNHSAFTFASLTANVTVPYAGAWIVTVTEGLLNPQTLLGSPYEVQVNPAPTDPTKTLSPALCSPSPSRPRTRF